MPKYKNVAELIKMGHYFNEKSKRQKTSKYSATTLLFPSELVVTLCINLNFKETNDIQQHFQNENYINN